MKKSILFIFLFVIKFNLIAQQIFPKTPDEIYGQLFVDVQMKKVFPDNKTFVDCTPKKEPASIVRNYNEQKNDPEFELNKFIDENFNKPPTPPAFNYVMQEKNVSKHINNLWSVLSRNADEVSENSSLLALPNPYIVPGGRFREIYYWDSYFTMLGLKESGEVETIEHMIDNFAFLIRTYGHIPNGNRTYYLSRSQPPFFSLMVELLASIKGNQIYLKYKNELEKEYAYWMEGASNLKPGQAYKRVVRMQNGTYLNRYWDDEEKPRQESYAADVITAEHAVSMYTSNKKFDSPQSMEHAADSIRKKIYRNLRAAACSGWDFSNRWFADNENLTSIETVSILPVDLNALLNNLEAVIQKARSLSKTKQTKFKIYKRGDLNTFFWNEKINFYADYQFENQQKLNRISLGGMFPLCFKNYSNNIQSSHALKMAKVIRGKLLKPGGLVSVPTNTKQQWDAPNGWAPLQWMSIWGLEQNGQKDLAAEIAKRWVSLNNDVYLRTGKLMEKYNVENLQLEAGGGEYPGQDGFGWTNGVLLALINKYELNK